MRMRREAAAGVIAVAMGALIAPQIPRTMPEHPATESPAGEDASKDAASTANETKEKGEATGTDGGKQAEEANLGKPEPVENESPDGLPDLPGMPTASLGEDNGMPEVSEEVLAEDRQSTFVMPEGAKYDPNVALISVDAGTPLDAVNDRLAKIDGIEPVRVTEEDIEAGYVMVGVTGEQSMEDTINELLRTGVVSTAQPDYAYDARDMIDAEEPLAQEDKAQTAEPTITDDEEMGEQPVDKEEKEIEAPKPVDKEEQKVGASKSVDKDEPNERDKKDERPVDTEEADEEPITSVDEKGLSEEEGITPVEGSGESEPEGVTNDTLIDNQWGLDDIRAGGAWTIHGDNSGITVAVIDTGFFVNHEDLAENMYRSNGRPVTYDAASDKENADVSPRSGLDISTYQHGTHVAGIIGAVTNNKKGVAGAGKNVKILPISVVDSDLKIRTSSILRALAYVKKHAREYNIRAVNVSLGHATTASEETSATDSAYKQLYDAGVVIASSAGNFGANSDGKAYGHYPSDCPYGVAVIALSQGSNPSRASFSNYNRSLSDHKDMSAPGRVIWSTVDERSYGAMSGTSMATPFVTATAAMIFAANPNLTAQQAIDILHSTARDLGPAGYDLDYGYGEVDAYSAVKAAKKGTPASPSQPSQPSQPSPAQNDTKETRSLSYRTHVQSHGWLGWQGNGGTAGTTGQSKRMEGIQIRLQGAPYSGGIRYRTHCQSIGWQDWVSDGALGGTTGEAKRMEAIQIELTGEMANHYDVWYRTHAQNYGWLGWTSNGQRSGTSALGLRLEAIEIRIQPKGKKAPGNTANSYHTHFVRYQTHIQTNGWMGNAYDGGMSGSTGQGKRMEGIMISLVDPPCPGGIRYRAHCQGIGWQNWVENGALAGTTGQARRMEAIQIELTGELAARYDVWYRTHIQSYGWMDWTKNGAESGSAGLSKRIEAVEIQLVSKGSNPPGPTTTPFRHR